MHTKNKLLAIESIRGLACFMVLLSHFSLTFFPYMHAFDEKADPITNGIQSFIHESPFGFFYSGSSAVFIFFVLSGFILTKVALKKENREVDIVSMGLKRYPRLMVPVLASCLIAYTSFFLFNSYSPHLTQWINHYGSLNYSLMGAIYNGTIDVFFLSGDSAYNPVLWTMQIELFGSFVVYLLCLNRKRPTIPCLVGIAFLLTAVLTYGKIISSGLGLGLVSFYGGYLFALYGKRIPNSVAALLMITGLYFAGVHNTSQSYSLIHSIIGQRTYTLCNFLSGFLIVYAIVFNERLNQLLSGRIFVFMGKVSFSVYLIHMPILSTLGVFLFNNLYEYSGQYATSALLALTAVIISTYACSIIFYKAVDFQSIKISNVFAKNITKQIPILRKAAY